MEHLYDNRGEPYTNPTTELYPGHLMPLSKHRKQQGASAPHYIDSTLDGMRLNTKKRAAAIDVKP